jgi:hypothetical protein
MRGARPRARNVQSEEAMNEATKLLKSHHDEVAELFEEIEKAKSKDDKNALLEELAGKLVAHDAIEREIFYPACEEEMGMDDLLGEALVEHGLVEFALYQAVTASEDDVEYKVTVLKEVIEHHVEEEENELFPKVHKAFTKERAAEIAEMMTARFEEALEEDFREPLVTNLRKVLDGDMKADAEEKTSGNGKKKAAKKAPKKRPSRRASAN